MATRPFLAQHKYDPVVGTTATMMRRGVLNHKPAKYYVNYYPWDSTAGHEQPLSGSVCQSFTWTFSHRNRWKFRPLRCNVPSPTAGGAICSRACQVPLAMPLNKTSALCHCVALQHVIPHCSPYDSYKQLSLPKIATAIRLDHFHLVP